jgi:hypothetical protein
MTKTARIYAELADYAISLGFDDVTAAPFTTGASATCCRRSVVWAERGVRAGTFQRFSSSVLPRFAGAWLAEHPDKRDEVESRGFIAVIQQAASPTQ